MSTKAERYHGFPFKGYHGVMQGDLLFTKIFNVVMGMVMRHWSNMAEAEEARQ